VRGLKNLKGAAMLLSNEEKMQMKKRFENQDYISKKYHTYFGESDYVWNWMGQLGYRFGRMSDAEIQTWANNIDHEIEVDDGLILEPSKLFEEI